MSFSPLSRRLFLRQAAVSSAAAGLAGCGGISALAPAAPQVYELTPKNTFATDLPKVTWQLLVDMPTANAGIDTDRIAISETQTSLDYFAKVAWVDRAPAMVVGLLVESFENTGKIVSVGRQISGLRANYVLQPEIREFRAERWQGPALPGAGADRRQAGALPAADDHRRRELRTGGRGEGAGLHGCDPGLGRRPGRRAEAGCRVDAAHRRTGRPRRGPAAALREGQGRTWCRAGAPAGAGRQRDGCVVSG
ncbi:ABC-type transport auxiliary lipoprotein family protein [Inquilinus limosus]|uniref:ABC-type transport auxiliary lipoprotein family protein n=1 Tax=Inquilinus limosus TaxID=171674 RepID=UPI00126A6056|nr:ABC-type transport auxiliary lipoprotein family protein [Inquilinus limosus]